MWLHFEEKWRLQPLGGPRDCTICQEPLYNFNVMSCDFGKHMYILRSYQGNWAQELIRYTRSLRWRKVMVIKHYSGMASHWPVIWYQVCASRTGHQKTSKLSQELQSSIDLASFTTYLPFCSPMWTWTNHFLFPTHFLKWDPGSVFHLAAMLWSFILECDSSSSCCSSFSTLVWFVFLSLLFLSPFKKPPESSVLFHALLFCNPHGCTRYISVCSVGMRELILVILIGIKEPAFTVARLPRQADCMTNSSHEMTKLSGFLASQ